MTHQDDPFHDKMISLMTEKKYALAVAEILELEDEWFNSLLERFVIDELQKFASENSLDFFYDSDEPTIRFNKPQWEYYCIMIDTGRSQRWGPMYYGISWYNKPKTRIIKNQKSLDCLVDSPVRDWPYGTSWFIEEFKYWNNSLVESIINGNLANYIKSCVIEVLAEIEEKDINMY